MARQPYTITVTIHPDPPKPPAEPGTLRHALENRQRVAEYSEPLVIRRTDHPHYAGDYFYAILKSEKHAWARGDSLMTQDMIADAWYAADCP